MINISQLLFNLLLPEFYNEQPTHKHSSLDTMRSPSANVSLFVLFLGKNVPFTMTYSQYGALKLQVNPTNAFEAVPSMVKGTIQRALFTVLNRNCKQTFFFSSTRCCFIVSKLDF